MSTIFTLRIFLNFSELFYRANLFLRFREKDKELVSNNICISKTFVLYISREDFIYFLKSSYEWVSGSPATNNLLEEVSEGAGQATGEIEGTRTNNPSIV